MRIVNAASTRGALTFQHGARQLDAGRLYKKANAQATGNRVAMQQKGTRTAHGKGSKHHDSGLLTIGLFKLVEAVFFLLVGVGAFHFLHRDLGDAAQHLVDRLRMDPDGRLVSWVMDHIDDITAHRLRQIGVATFFYAGLRVTEGVGLILEKAWAEYMTVGVTLSFLPWELYEILRRPDWIRVCLLITNLLVLAYLLWWLKRKRSDKQVSVQ